MLAFYLLCRMAFALIGVAAVAAVAVAALGLLVVIVPFALLAAAITGQWPNLTRSAR